MTDIVPGSDIEASRARHVQRNSPFSPVLPHFQIAWDSTSLGTFKECARKYYYTLILGWHSKYTSVHLKFGQLYHSGMEAYDHFSAGIGKLGGGLSDDEHQAGIRAALRHVLSEAGTLVDDGTGTVRWVGWQSSDAYKNMWTLCRSIVWYLDKFRASRLRTVLLANGKPAVELSFYFQVGDVGGIGYGFCGHLDRVVSDPDDHDRESTHDRKTTKGQINAGYWKGFNPHNQFALYTVANIVHYERPVLGITVDAAQVLVNSTSFARQFIPFPRAVADEWVTEAHTWISLAHRMAERSSELVARGQDPSIAWPKNDKSCGNYGGCAFIGVCSKSPGFRQNWLEADFLHRPWNPLATRGDI